MEGIQVLDCTLRDGGYCNECHFGAVNIEKIITGLMEANLDIVEIGFLTEKVSFLEDVTKYPTIELASGKIPADREGKLFVGLMNYGEFDIDHVPNREEGFLDGIRLAFHKKDYKSAMEFCARLKEKGYLVFVQPMVSLSYLAEEFLELMKLANELEPYAFYLVDSFGKMKRRELIALQNMAEETLKESIRIGFHSHNNLQLAFANAQTLIDNRKNHRLIVDSTVFGMGRGAGNLNTELFLQYLNDEAMESHYEIRPLLLLIDEILNDFYQRKSWGYSLPNYLSAKYDIHPNYATYLQDKGTLLMGNMDEIFSKMEPEYRYEYNKAYIEKLYQDYMQGGARHEEHLDEMTASIRGKKVLLIAPGLSSYDERARIAAFCEREDVVSISINHDYGFAKTDYIFVSNLRRFRQIAKHRLEKCIVTSNVPGSDAYLQLDYEKLLIDEEYVRDNSTLMMIRLLSELAPEEILLAGVDGYSYDQKENYTPGTIFAAKTEDFITGFNLHMSRALANLAKEAKVKITFFTEARYIRL